jgi:hypothetical protein
VLAALGQQVLQAKVALEETLRLALLLRMVVVAADLVMMSVFGVETQAALVEVLGTPEPAAQEIRQQLHLRKVITVVMEETTAPTD